MRKLLLLLTFLFVSPVYAQEATPSKTLVWDQTNVTDAVEAQNFTYRYYPDGSAVGTVLSGVTCVDGPVVTCSVAFPAFTPGAHTLTLTASNDAGESDHSTVFSFTFVVVPSPPENLRIG